MSLKSSNILFGNFFSNCWNTIVYEYGRSSNVLLGIMVDTIIKQIFLSFIKIKI